MSIFKKTIIDIEANNLMAPLLDYTSMPYKLKPEAKLWCIVLRGIEYTGNMSEVDDNIKLLVHKDYLNTKFPTHKVEFFGDFNKLIATEYYDDIETLREVIFESDLSQRLYEREKDTLIKSEMEEIEYNIWYNDFESKQIITKDNLREALKDTEVLIGHNIVNYDLPMLMLFNVLEYTIGFPGKPHTLFGRKIKIIDTLVMSKVFNPDRMDTYGRHALSAWGKRAGDHKIVFDRFDIFTAHLCFYCAQDTKSNEGALNLLELEKMEDDWGDKWNDALDLETKLIDLTLRQELVGFELDVELCHENLKELEGLLQEREDIIIPSLPPKPMGVTESKSYIPPKIQFKKDGSLSAIIVKFAEKHGATILEIPSKDDPDSKEYFFTYKDQSFKLPFEDQIETHTEAAVKDNEHIKIYLLSLGWEPTEWSERDLTKDSQKKALTADKVVQTIVRYADKTFNSGLRDHRLKMLELPLSMTQEDFVELYVDRYQENPRKPLKVVTSPKIKVGAEKEIDPKLLEIEDKKEFSIAFAEYTTYKHRKSSIAGGDIDEETGEPTKGYLSNYRPEDNRIPTPADTIGCACVTADTRIVTDVGYKYITEVTKGDLVLTHEGRYKPVIDWVNNGVKPVFLVQLENGATLKCTDNHPFYTDKGWVRVRDLTLDSQVFTNQREEEWVATSEFVTSKVKSITELSPEPTFDITVEDDHSYVANNIVTHNTSRYQHRVVANVPRSSSIYGAPMRSLFKAGKNWVQAAFDFASLEVNCFAYS